jgi:hypothetical protein
MDTKVLKTFSHGLEGNGELVASLETSRQSSGSFQFSKDFQYVARLGDTKTATVYLAKGPDGECAIKAST